MAPKHLTDGPIRAELYDDSDAGRVVYVAIDTDGVWARSEFPDDLMTLDYDEDGRLIGIELIGDLAMAINEGLLRTMVESIEQPELLKSALEREKSRAAEEGVEA